MNEQPITITWNGGALPNEEVGIERCVCRQNAFGMAYCEIVLYGNQDSLRSLQLTGQDITVIFEKKLNFQGTVVAGTTMLSQLGGHPTRQFVATSALALICRQYQPRAFYGESIKKVMQTILNPVPLTVKGVASIPSMCLPQVVQLAETHGELLAWLLDMTSTWIMLDNSQNVVWRTWLPQSTNESQAYRIDDTQNSGIIILHEEVATPSKDAHILATGYDHQQGQAQAAKVATETLAASQLRLSMVGEVDVNPLAELRRARQLAWEKGLSGILPIIEDKLSCGQVVNTDDGPRYVIDSVHAWQLGDRGYTLFSTVPGGIHWLLQQYSDLEWVGDWLADITQDQWPWHSRPQGLKSADSVLLGTVKAYHPKHDKTGLTDAVEITLPVGDQLVEVFARQTHPFLFPDGSGGLQAPPQPGTEVALRFLDQQPLVPVVIGYLGNSRHPPPSVDATLQPIVLQTGDSQLMLSKESDGLINLMAGDNQLNISKESEGQINLMAGDNQLNISNESEGIINLTAASEVSLQSGNTQLKLSKKESETVELLAAGEMKFTSGKTLEIQGQTLSLAQTTSPPTVSAKSSPSSAKSSSSSAKSSSSSAASSSSSAASSPSSAASSPSSAASSPSSAASSPSSADSSSGATMGKNTSPSAAAVIKTSESPQSQSEKKNPDSSGNLISALWEYGGKAALCGEPVKLVANTKEAEGETVEFTIYCCGIDGGADTEVKTLSATVANNRAEAEWVFEEEEDNNELPKYPPKKGKSLAIQHYFKATMDNSSLESPRLTWQTSLCLSIEDEQQHHYPQMRYRLIDAAGVKHDGAADSDGCINIDALAAGPWWIELKPVKPSPERSVVPTVIHKGTTKKDKTHKIGIQSSSEFPTSDTKWYEKFSFKINDPFNITMLHAFLEDKNRIIGTFSRTGYRTVSQGEVYVIFSQDELQKIEDAGDRKYIHYENQLEKDTADYWKKEFAKRSEVKRVPFWISALGLIPMPRVVSLALTATILLFDEVLASQDVKTVTAGILSELIAPGGKFIQYFTIRSDQEKHPYLHSDMLYHVTVQGEQRSYLIFSSIHAVKVDC